MQSTRSVADTGLPLAGSQAQRRLEFVSDLNAPHAPILRKETTAASARACGLPGWRSTRGPSRPPRGRPSTAWKPEGQGVEFPASLFLCPRCRAGLCRGHRRRNARRCQDVRVSMPSVSGWALQQMPDPDHCLCRRTVAFLCPRYRARRCDTNDYEVWIWSYWFYSLSVGLGVTTDNAPRMYVQAFLSLCPRCRSERLRLPRKHWPSSQGIGIWFLCPSLGLGLRRPWSDSSTRAGTTCIYAPDVGLALRL